VTKARTRKLSGEEGLNTRFYLIRDNAHPAGFVGKPVSDGTGSDLAILYLFDNRDDAEKYLRDFLDHLGTHEDPDRWEIASSDKFGGILLILQMTSDFFDQVTLNPGWSKVCWSMRPEHFIYLVRAFEAGLSVDEIPGDAFRRVEE
jgi:hypothetical protein